MPVADAGPLAMEHLCFEDDLESRALPDDERPLVLIVGESRSLQRSLAQNLAPECRTVSALDLRRALDRAAALRPDAIVLELLRETVDGPAWIGTLRAGPARDAAVLALTSGHDPDLVVRLLDAGAEDALAKPLSLPEVRARVRRLIVAKQVRDLLAHTVGRRDADLMQLAKEVDDKQRALEDTLAELEHARAIAERASQIKSSFLRMMSHELKTPITAIQLHLRVLERDPTVPATDRLREGLERIGRSTRRLLHLADTIIEWARVESGRRRPSIEQVDALALVSDIAEDLGSYARQKRLALVLNPAVPSVSISTDRRLVQILVAGLISRAIQVSDSGDVEITVDRDAEGLRVAVRDSAAPISPESQDEIFDPMPFAHDLHRQSGAGSGLGLHVVRDLAHALHGDVVLESGAPGNTFVLTLPDAPRDASGSGEHRPSSQAQA